MDSNIINNLGSEDKEKINKVQNSAFSIWTLKSMERSLSLSFEFGKTLTVITNERRKNKRGSKTPVRNDSSFS
jgi:hypothetical protein